jgi:hypothetical protein
MAPGLGYDSRKGDRVMEYDYSDVERMAERAYALGEPRANPYAALALATTAERREHRQRLSEAWERGWSRQARADEGGVDKYARREARVDRPS